jgi:hypothetical protein
MYITGEQYRNRERFQRNFDCDFETFLYRLVINEGNIYKFKNIIAGGEGYVKITCEFANMLFDTKECNENGNLIRFGCRMGSVKKSEIAERIYEGDWKLDYFNKYPSIWY